jgi:hypothetical protein
MKTFKQFLTEGNGGDLPVLSGFAIVSPDQTSVVLQEDKWVNGRFDRSIRIDQATHRQGEGQTHAHLYARNCQQYGVVNLDGTASHGEKCKVHPRDAAELSKRNFTLPTNNIVEWFALEGERQFLIEG